MLLLRNSRLARANSANVELTFILLLFIFGLPTLVLVPPGAGYDEEDHLVRAWELSRLSFIPGQLSPQEMQYPLTFRNFAYRQQGSAGVIDNAFWQKYARMRLYDEGMVRREIDTKSVYSPALLLPQALILHLLTRDPDRPVLIVFYACRLASLLSYLLLVWLALRLIPSGKWILLVLALAPMALFQAATLTPDALSNGIGFLFIAGTLRLADRLRLGWKEAGSLLLLVFLLFLAKLNLIPLILLPFLLFGPGRFAPKKIYVVLLGGALALLLVEAIGWNLIAAGRSGSLLANEADPAAQLLFIASYPLTFLFIVIRDLFTNGGMYLQGWINGYGYYYWTPPAMVSVLFLLSLVAVLVVDSAARQASVRYRPALLLVFVAAYAATVASLYLTFTPVGSGQVYGVQGRYFVPLALLLFMALPGLRSKDKARAPSSTWAPAFLTTGLAMNVLGIWLAFHVPCGTTYYQTGLCYQPLSRDFTGTRLSPAVSRGLSLSQEIDVACDGLAEVRLLPGPGAPAGEETTRFILEDSGSGRTLLERSIANDSVSFEDWLSLPFDPDWQSAGRTYVLRILSPETPSTRGLQMLYTNQPEFDLGQLYENDRPMEADLVVQYGCATGLRKIRLTGLP